MARHNPTVMYVTFQFYKYNRLNHYTVVQYHVSITTSSQSVGAPSDVRMNIIGTKGDTGDRSVHAASADTNNCLQAGVVSI